MNRFGDLLSAVRVMMACCLILIPSIGEARLVTLAEMPLEFFGDERMLVTVGKDMGLNLTGNLLVVNGGEELGEDCTKRGAGLDEVGPPFPSQRQAMRHEPRETQANTGKKPEVGSAKDNAENVHPSVWLLVAAIVVSLFQSRPNVCHNRQ